MLLIILTTAIIIPKIHAAAGSGQTPQEQYIALAASQGASVEAITDAFLGLSKFDQVLAKNLVPLVEALLRSKIIDSVRINRLAKIFKKSNPLIPWLLSPSIEPSADVLKYLEDLKKILHTRSSYEEYLSNLEQRFGGSDAGHPIPSLSELSLRAIGKSMAQDVSRALDASDVSPVRMYVSADRQITAEDSTFYKKAPFLGYLKEKIMSNPYATAIVDLLRQSMYQASNVGRMEALEESDLWSYINTIRIGGNHIEEPVAVELINYIAPILAYDEYMRLRTVKKLGPGAAYGALSPFLRKHFKGISVTDLIENGLLPNVTFAADGQRMLDLSGLYLNSLKGLKDIPEKKYLVHLALEDNMLPPEELLGTLDMKELANLSSSLKEELYYSYILYPFFSLMKRLRAYREFSR